MKLIVRLTCFRTEVRDKPIAASMELGEKVCLVDQSLDRGEVCVQTAGIVCCLPIGLLSRATFMTEAPRRPRRSDDVARPIEIGQRLPIVSARHLFRPRAAMLTPTTAVTAVTTLGIAFTSSIQTAKHGSF